MLNIIFIHRGYSDYLEFTIRQARWSSPTATIYLLGDLNNRLLIPGVIHVDTAGFQSAAVRFLSAYVHLSTHPKDFELFCILRWIILNEWCLQSHVHGSLFYVDSDAMVYADLADLERKYLHGCDLTVTGQWGQQFTYFRDAAVLAEFVMHIWSCYGDGGINHLREVYSSYLSSGHQSGGISDMYLLRLFSEKRGCFLDLGTLADRPYFDPNPREEQGFLSTSSGNAISWRRGRPMYTKRCDRSRVVVGGIHFGGASKSRIPRSYAGPLFFSMRYFRYRIWELLRRMKRHIMRLVG